MAKKLNTPSANFLIPREHRIRAIQELYDAVRNGGGGGGGGIEDLTPAQKAALNSGITADKLNELETGVSGAVQTSSQSLTESQKSTARNNIGALGTNDVPPVPSGGWAAANDLSALDAYVHSLNTTPVVVGPKPETGTEGTVYRVPGDTTYTDWMYYNGTWNALATYDAATLESQFGYYKWTGTGNAIALTTSNQDAGSPIGSYDIKTGGSFKIKMTNAATGAATLSMNGKTATPLYYNGIAVSSSNTWEAGEVVDVYYDGTNYQATNAQGGGGSAVGKKQLKGSSGFINLNTEIGQTVPATVTQSQNAIYKEIKVKEGDVFLLTIKKSGTSARAWGFIDSNRVLLDVADANITLDNEIIVVPEGVDKVILHAAKDSTESEIIYEWYYAKAGSVGAHEMLTEAYLYGDVRLLAVGQTYEENEAVKTTDKQLLRVTKEILEMNLADEVAIGDLKAVTSGNKLGTYQALKAVVAYDEEGEYSSGDYAIADGVVKVYDGEAWTAVVLADWVADANMWEEIPINILITKYTVQDSIYKDLDNVSVIHNNVFNFETATNNTNNSTYITPTKTVNGFKWTVKKKDTANARQAQIVIKQFDSSKNYLSVGKTYKVSFDFNSTLTSGTVVTLYFDAYYQAGSTSGSIATQIRYLLTSDLLSDFPLRHFEGEVFVDREDVQYLTFRFPQPVAGQYLEVYNILIEEVKVVKNAVDKIDNYIYNNKNLLRIGQCYNKGDEVFTTTKDLRVLEKDILEMNLFNEVYTGDLKVYGNNTFVAIKDILVFDAASNYNIGDYCVQDGVVKKYDGSAWTATTLANLSADTSVYKKLSADDLVDYTKEATIPKLYNDFGLNSDGAISQDKLFYELHDFNTLSFPAVITGRKIDGANGKWSRGNDHKYYLFPVEPGQVYRITANPTYYANYAWLISVPVNTTSGGTPPYAPGENNQYQVKAGKTADIQVPLGTKYMYIFSALRTGEVYRPSSVAIARPIVSTSSERLNTLEKGTPYTLPRLLKLAKYRTDAIKNISILHYSDLHADTIAFNELKEVYNEYGDTFDAILETGDRTYTVATGAAPNLADEVLFVPGNHDVCDGTGTAGYSWPAYTPEYLFNKFVAPYKDARGITLPEGWNVEGDPHQNALYWYKDFDNGADKVRIIGIDCMRYYHMNENESEFDNDAQEKWLCDTLADAQTNGFKVIVASHYSLDDYSGAYAKWDEENHVWKYNYVDDPVNNTGGHVMNRMTNTPVGFHNRTTTSFTSSNTQHLRNRTSRNSKGQTNNFGDIITAWIEGGSAFNNYITFPGGGVFIAWICGHLHNNIMFYPTRYPKILNIVTTCAGTTMWGYNTDTPSVNRREDTIYRRLSANAYFIQGNYLKIVRIGNNLSNGLLVPSTWMTINYVTGEVITEG